MLSKSYSKICLVASIVVVFGFLLFVRLYRLNQIPGVLNGDETAGILHPLQMYYGNLTFFDLTHDGSVPAFLFLPKLVTMLVIGFDHALLATRFVTALYSYLALIIFYLILKKEVGVFVASLTTFVFGTSYWYLNFSRLSWIAVDNIFWSLLLYFLIRKFMENLNSGTVTRGIVLETVLTGFVFTMVAINYMGGRIAVLAAGIILYVNRSAIFSNKKNMVLLLILFLSAVVSLSPFVRLFIQDKSSYLARPANLFVWNLKTQYYQIDPKDKISILKHQIIYVVRGFVLFDWRVSGEGIENHRLLPFKSPAINYILVPIYYLGLIMSLLKKKGLYFILLIIFNIVILQIPSVLIPSWSRALIVLPAIYYFVALGLLEIITFAKKYFDKQGVFSIMSVIVFLTVLIGIADLRTYWSWVKSDEFKNSQQPAILIEEIPAYQKIQVERIKDKKYPLNFGEWNELKK